MIYTIFTGSKLKGFWTKKDKALEYMAISKPDSDAWSLLEIDESKTINDQIPDKPVSAAPAGNGVHNLKADPLEVKPKAK